MDSRFLFQINDRWKDFIANLQRNNSKHNTFLVLVHKKNSRHSLTSSTLVFKQNFSNFHNFQETYNESLNKYIFIVKHNRLLLSRYFYDSEKFTIWQVNLDIKGSKLLWIFDQTPIKMASTYNNSRVCNLDDIFKMCIVYKPGTKNEKYFAFFRPEGKWKISFSFFSFIPKKYRFRFCEIFQKNYANVPFFIFDK